jgi:hypothetical protein
MSHLEQGQIEILLKNPLSSETFYVKDVDRYLRDENNILIYLDDEAIPYCMKRTYFINLLMEDFDYECKDEDEGENKVNTRIKYYNLSKLFLNISNSPRIVIKMSDMKHIFDIDCTTFKLTSLERKKKTYTNIDFRRIQYDEHGEEYTHTETPFGTPKKWKALVIYCGNGFPSINNYLVRLTDYLIPTIFDIPGVREIYSFFGFSVPPKNTSKQREKNEKIQDMIDDIDHLFYKYAEKTKKERVVYRGMASFYTYLKEPGDKMVIENYMSCFEKDGGTDGPSNIMCQITIEPGIPYIDTWRDKEAKRYIEYTREKEVLLPRNLVATYNGDYKDDVLIPMKLITVSLLYPNQFGKEVLCNEMDLYKIQKSRNNSFIWEEIEGGRKKYTHNKHRYKKRFSKKNYNGS